MEDKTLGEHKKSVNIEWLLVFKQGEVILCQEIGHIELSFIANCIFKLTRFACSPCHKRTEFHSIHLRQGQGALLNIC